MRPLTPALALLLSLSVARAAEPPKAPAAPVVAPDKSGVVIVPVGSVSALKLRAGKAATEIVVSNDAVLSVRLDPADAGSLLLTGKAAGSATLTVKYGDEKDVFEVVVEFARKPLAKLLRPGYVAYTIAVPPENAVGGHLGLNDYVIVYYTKATDPDKRTAVLMKNIRVLGTPTGTEARCSVPLEVTTEEARLLKNASETGTLSLGMIAAADLKDEKALQDRGGDTAPPRK